MRKKGKARIWWGLLFLLLAGLLIFAGYHIFMKKDHAKQAKKEVLVSKKVSSEKSHAPKKVEQVIPQEKKIVLPEKTEEIQPTAPVEKDPCNQIENQVAEFFKYLDKKSYIQKIEQEMDTYARFKEVIRTLSDRPPIPAGESVASRILTGNIFYFFRLLDKKDLRLIREVIRNESDTMEMNLELFYKWLTLGERCPDPERIRPHGDVLYKYAGFFLNTIGGRAYLFRRPMEVRLLVNYYCLLIIHEADKRGKNIYGIDIFPEIAPLAKEISLFPDFHFQGEYLHQLTRLQNYYLAKR